MSNGELVHYLIQWCSCGAVVLEQVIVRTAGGEEQHSVRWREELPEVAGEDPG